MISIYHNKNLIFYYFRKERIALLEGRLFVLERERMPQQERDVINLSAQFATGRSGECVWIFKIIILLSCLF